MKRWSLFLLLSLLLHGIILTLLGLFPSHPASLEELRTSVMEVRLVAFPESSSSKNAAVSDSAPAKDESLHQPEVLAEPETATKTEAVAEDPVEPVEIVPTLPDPPSVPPEVQSEKKPPVSKPPEPVADKPVLKPKKKTPPPDPKPEQETKPKPQAKPKPHPVPDKKPRTTVNSVKSPTADKSPTQPAGVPGTEAGKKAETSGKTVANTQPGPAILQIAPGDILKKVTPRYPMVSRRRGEEGKVVFILTVRKGQIKALATDSSSGHERLDLAAKQAVKAWRFRQDLDGVFRIPVIFKLDG